MFLDAPNGRAGLALCEVYEGPINLLVSDVVMLELGGGGKNAVAAHRRGGLLGDVYWRPVVLLHGHESGPAPSAPLHRQTAERNRYP